MLKVETVEVTFLRTEMVGYLNNIFHILKQKVFIAFLHKNIQLYQVKIAGILTLSFLSICHGNGRS